MRKWIFIGLGVTALIIGRRAGRSRALVGGSDTPAPVMVDTTRQFLLGFVLPLWLLAGVADWLCHRKANIEHTAGPAESSMHLLMLSEAAVPVLAGLFLDITSPVLLLMAGAFLLHEATALWDVTYASRRRTVTPVEQHVHSYLEMVPLMALSFVSVLHWPQVLALCGVEGYRRDWGIRRKPKPLPIRYVAPMLVAMVVLEWAPYLEEFWRGVRATRTTTLKSSQHRPALF